jgi:hypothetical protein
VHGVIDGAYSDNTGIANAVAAGADEVLVVINSVRTAARSDRRSQSDVRRDRRRQRETRPGSRLHCFG